MNDDMTEQERFPLAMAAAQEKMWDVQGHDILYDLSGILGYRHPDGLEDTLAFSRGVGDRYARALEEWRISHADQPTRENIGVPQLPATEDYQLPTSYVVADKWEGAQSSNLYPNKESAEAAIHMAQLLLGPELSRADRLKVKEMPREWEEGGESAYKQARMEYEEERLRILALPEDLEDHFQHNSEEYLHACQAAADYRWCLKVMMMWRTTMAKIGADPAKADLLDLRSWAGLSEIDPTEEEQYRGVILLPVLMLAAFMGKLKTVQEAFDLRAYRTAGGGSPTSPGVEVV